MRFRHLAIFALALLIGLSGCTRRQKDEVGVVARVNGKAITLEHLEFQYDLLHFDALSGVLPSVSSLREAYGEILGGLIAQELVAQELEKRGQQVTDEELAEAEAKVRADYPDDTFDQMLADEFIDLPMWRRQLRYARGMEKFQVLVLRPMVHLDYREVETYYHEHLNDFRLPERLRLLVVRAMERGPVEKALAQYQKLKDINALADGQGLVQVREVVVPRDLISPAWADALHGGDPGGHGAILAGRGGFEGLLLLERLPAQTLDIAQAYSQVEASLVEQRLQQALDSWLQKAVDASVIMISERLLHPQPDEDLAPEAPAEDHPQQNVASGNETG